MKFVDEARVKVQAGNGGRGCRVGQCFCGVRPGRGLKYRRILNSVFSCFADEEIFEKLKHFYLVG